MFGKNEICIGQDAMDRMMPMHLIVRIQEVLKNEQLDTSLQFGLIAFYIDRGYKTGNAKENVQKRIYKIYNEIKEQYPEMSCRLAFREKEIINDNNDAWSSVVFLLKVK